MILVENSLDSVEIIPINLQIKNTQEHIPVLVAALFPVLAEVLLQMPF